jgi:cupin fold WbuC family metalloprotein
MERVYSRLEPGRVLHIINRLDGISGRTEVVDPDNFIQLATLRMENGKTFRPHKHIWKDGPALIIAQESWVVIKGSVKVLMYDLDGEYLYDATLFPGDASITLAGGHNYEILEDDTVVYEYKTGPYTGQENDKVFI